MSMKTILPKKILTSTRVKNSIRCNLVHPMLEKGDTKVYRVTWSEDAENEEKAKNLIVMARRHTDKALAKLRGVNFVMSCITGVSANRSSVLSIAMAINRAYYQDALLSSCYEEIKFKSSCCNPVSMETLSFKQSTTSNWRLPVTTTATIKEAIPEINATRPPPCNSINGITDALKTIQISQKTC